MRVALGPSAHRAPTRRKPAPFARCSLVLLAVSIALLIGLPPAHAQRGDAESRAAVDAAFAQAREIGLANDFDAFYDTMPPAILALRAERAGAPLDAYVEGLKVRDRVSAEGLETLAYEFLYTRGGSLDLPGGGYAVIVPSLSIVRADGATFALVAETVALEDDGRWYVYRITGDAERELLASAYPAFAAVPLRPNAVVPLPPSTFEAPAAPDAGAVAAPD